MGKSVFSKRSASQQKRRAKEGFMNSGCGTIVSIIVFIILGYIIYTII